MGHVLIRTVVIVTEDLTRLNTAGVTTACEKGYHMSTKRLVYLSHRKACSLIYTNRNIIPNPKSLSQNNGA